MDNHHVSLDKPCKSYLIILFFGNLLKLPADNLNWFPNAPPCAATRCRAFSGALRGASNRKIGANQCNLVQPVQPWLPCQKFLGDSKVNRRGVVLLMMPTLADNKKIKESFVFF
jgi:hypothetical protein